jgi:hypothetical protein
MANKKTWFGILIIVLVFGMIVVGCDNTLTDGYTFEFKVQYSHWIGWGGGGVNKIEFINGSTSDGPILATETVNLGDGDLTSAYKVSGFTNKEGGGYIYGVKAYFNDGSGAFVWGTSEKNGGKIKVVVANYTPMCYVEEGTW